MNLLAFRHVGDVLPLLGRDRIRFGAVRAMIRMAPPRHGADAVPPAETPPGDIMKPLISALWICVA